MKYDNYDMMWLNITYGENYCFVLSRFRFIERMSLNLTSDEYFIDAFKVAGTLSKLDLLRRFIT